MNVALLLPMLAALQQTDVQDRIVAMNPPKVDTVEAFWSLPTDFHQLGASSAFRQLGAFGSPDRVVINPCIALEGAKLMAPGTLEQALADSARVQPDSAALWIRLGCVRSFREWPIIGPLAREEFVLTPAVQWSGGAIAALLRATAIAPRDSVALILLAREALRIAPGRLYQRPQGSGAVPAVAYGLTFRWGAVQEAPSLTAAASSLYQSVRLGPVPAEVVRACTSLMIDIGDLAAAHDCSMRALATGSDSTWHALRLAWLAFLRGDPVAGTGWFKAAAAAAHDRPARVELGWQLEADHDWRATYAVSRYDHLPSDPGTDPSTADMHDIRAEKDAWLARPDSELLTALGTRLAKSPWISLARNGIAAHFRSITYNGTAFRDCVPGRDSLPPCGRADSHRSNDILNVAARRSQIWDPASGEPMTLFVYGVSADNLAVNEVDGHRVIEIDARLTQSSAGEAVWQDTVITLRVPAPATTTASVTGHVLAPTARSFTAWTFTMQQPRSIYRGGVFEERQPAISSAAVALSDVIVGNANSRGIPWKLGDTGHFATVPGAAVDRKVPLDLYYQIRSTAPRSDLRVTIAFYREGQTTPALQVGAAARGDRIVNESDQVVDISRLKSGKYRIEVSVADKSGVRDVRSVGVEVK